MEHGASILTIQGCQHIVKHRDELTKSSERVLKHSAVSLLTDGQLPWRIDVDEARSILAAVAAKVETWAAKRKLGVVALSSRLVMRCLSESGVCVTVYTNMKGSFEVVQYTYVLEAEYTEIGYRMAPHTQPHQTPVRPQVFSQGACKGSGRAHLLWRTDEIAPQAPPKAPFLM